MEERIRATYSVHGVTFRTAEHAQQAQLYLGIECIRRFAQILVGGLEMRISNALEFSLFENAVALAAASSSRIQQKLPVIKFQVS